MLQTVLQENAATELELEALLDHFHDKFARHPISEAEVIAGRGYTGPLFVKMNGSLRAVSGKFPASMTEHLKGNTYTNLIYACNSLLRKFSQISNIPKGRVVYRGLSGVNLPQCFEECEEGGGRGGVDFGFLSTTRRREVAASYIGDKGKPVLFMFEVGDIDRGASLSFLSQYPNEEEILIPPLSYLEVIGEPFFMETDKGDVKVYRARINCNLKSQTLEEIVAHRQKEVLALVPYLDAALSRDMPSVAAALVADLEEDLEEERTLEEKVEELEELQAQILLGFEQKRYDLATKEKTSWYTATPLVDGTHAAGRCGGARIAPADAGCPCAGSTRTPTTRRPFAMSSNSSTLGSRDSSRCSRFAPALYSCARHLRRG